MTQQRSMWQGIANSIEQRSIDYIPLEIRHGKGWHQAPFWFTGGTVLPSLLIGYIGPSMGLGIGWTLLAVMAGMAFGTLFMALHANQGPHLGLPQMIQSRAQFGAKGAIFPMMVAVFIYLGYNVFQFILSGEVVSVVAPGGKVWYLLFAVLALVIAIIGHDFLHVFQRWSSYFIVALFAIVTVTILVHYPFSGADPAASGFSLKVFLVQFAAAGGYQISYAIYVSDYSRYLPTNIPARKLIGWTYLGGVTGATWMACIGALLGSYVKAADSIEALHEVGNLLFPGFGIVVIFGTLPAMIGTSGVNAYGAMLTGVTIIDGIRHVKPSVVWRVAGLLVAGVIAAILSIALPENYLDSFNTFLVIMTYLLVPWTAVNLTDYYLVRRGHYVISDIVSPEGVYGQWAWRGLSAYFLGFLAMIPFFSLSFYEGPATKALGGADFSFVVGLAVSTVAYVLLTRGDAVVTTPARVPEADVAV